VPGRGCLSAHFRRSKALSPIDGRRVPGNHRASQNSCRTSRRRASRAMARWHLGASAARSGHRHDHGAPVSADGFILRLDHVTRRFGGLSPWTTSPSTCGEASVRPDRPNGAGKTTLFNGITGLIPPSSGVVEFDGRNITNLKPHQVAASGVARTFQNIRLFDYMSALDNVRVGQHCGCAPRSGTPSSRRRWSEPRSERSRRSHGPAAVRGDRAPRPQLRTQPRVRPAAAAEIARALASDPSCCCSTSRRRLHTPGEGRADGLVEKILAQGVTSS